MPQQSHSMLKSKHLEHSSEEKEIELFSYIDLLNYMLKYKIPQIVTLTQTPFSRSKKPYLSFSTAPFSKRVF